MAERAPRDDGVVLAARTAGLTAGVGVLILASTIVTTITGLMGLHNVVVGGLIAFVASVTVFLMDESPSIVAPAVLGLLGLWVVASPFLLGVSRALTVQLNVVLGGLVVVLALVGVYASVRSGRDETRTDRGGATAEE